MDYYRLLESRSAPLYHHASYEKTMDVLANNAMPARWEHEVPHVGFVKGNSMTRNNKADLFSGRPVRFVFDQQRLAQRHKILPLDGEVVYRFTDALGKLDGSVDKRPHNVRLKSRRNYTDRFINKDGYQLAEEFVVGDIDHLNRFIIRIEIKSSAHLSLYKTEELINEAIRYGEKYDIPVLIDPKLSKRVERDRELSLMDME